MRADIQQLRASLELALPPSARLSFHGTWVAFDFARASRHLRRVTEETNTIIGGIPDEWNVYHVFGEEQFPNGSAFYSIKEGDGSVHRIDVELASPISLVNRSTRQFIESFRHADTYFTGRSSTPSELGQILRNIDKEAYDGNNMWYELVDYLKDEQETPNQAL